MKHHDDIAIISMSGRFPMGLDITSLWQLLLEGGTTVTPIAEEKLKNSAHASIYQNPNYVPMCSMLSEQDMFDADVFKMNKSEAMITDPQQRLFLTCCLEALDSAGFPDPTSMGIKTGVFASCTINTYLFLNVFNSSQFANRDGMQILLGNEKDFIATRVAYKLNLTGATMTIQSGCSSSLVAIHQACESLRKKEVDLALAGSASLPTIEELGYLYTPEGPLSSDGRCKSFDAAADGTVFTDGVGVVALSRLEDALKFGNPIYAVIKGSAVNNNGNDCLNFTSPSINGQVEVIKEALKSANVDSRDISFVEAHGTGTYLGDPIEVKALSLAFDNTDKQYCALGSIKSNLGHTDTSSGVIGLIKAALALKHRILPATINFSTANPQLDIENTPFFICSQNYELDKNKQEHYASLSSFGFGGTNAHVILASAPVVEDEKSSRPPKNHLYLWSDRTQDSLNTYINQTIAVLQQQNSLKEEDVAYTLGRCRHLYESRAFLIEEGLPNEQSKPKIQYNKISKKEISLVYLFPGQGIAWPKQTQLLYQNNTIFKEHVDRLSEKFIPYLGDDIRRWLFPSQEDEEQANQKALQTKWTQPALFIISTGMVSIFKHYGIKADYMLGHSLGELIAAYIAQVFNEDEAVKLIANRALLMHNTQEGSMLAVSGGEEIYLSLPESIRNQVDIAAINSPFQMVFAGKEEYIDNVVTVLNSQNIKSKKLPVTRAFHSSLMDEILPKWKNVLEEIDFKNSSIPIVSNLYGNIQPVNQKIPTDYWINHIRQPVKFSEGVACLLEQIEKENKEPIFFEMSVGNILSVITQMNHSEANVRSFARYQESIDESDILKSLGELWSMNYPLNLEQIIEKARIVTLPVAKLNPQSYWIFPDKNDGDEIKETVNDTIDPMQMEENCDSLQTIDIENEIIKAWKKVILNDEISINDNFFSLGGDSLQALEITRELKKVGIDLKLTNILMMPTIVELVHYVENTLVQKQALPEVGINIESDLSDNELDAIIKQLGMD